MKGFQRMDTILLLVYVVVGLGAPILGVVRGVKNSSVLHSILSLILPIYGLVYFFLAKRA